MNITLVSANYDAGKYRKGENLGIKALEAFLSSHGHTVYIYDRNFVNIDDKELVRLIEYNSSKIVGFSVSFTHQIYETIRLARVMRSFLPNVHFTIGGQGISFIVQNVLENNRIFDSGICFEGELTFLELVQHFEGHKEISEIKGLYYQTDIGVTFNGYRNPVDNLDQFPFLLREASPQKMGLHHISMITSRGCMGNCLFCSSGYFSNRYHDSKKWRFRTASNIVQEIVKVKGSADKLAISFIDDNFLGGTQEGYARARRFSEEILEKGLIISWAIECRIDDIDFELFKLMQTAGLTNVFLGIESGNDEDLKLFNKGITLPQIDKAINMLEELKLTYNIGFIMFHPTSTIEQLIENALFLKKYINANSMNLLNELSLYHGSPLVKYYDKRGLISRRDYSITYRYENQSVKRVLNCAKHLLTSFLKFETQLSRMLFDEQNKCADFRKWSKYKQYTAVKKELSDFESDIFAELCRHSTSLENIYPVLENRVQHFKPHLTTKISQLQEDQ